jgi:hypothetical protein
MKFLNYFLLLWVIFALLDLDPDSKFGSGYRSRDPIESGSNPDPDMNQDPQHCLVLTLEAAASSG